jgi:hypothetical protein
LEALIALVDPGSGQVKKLMKPEASPHRHQAHEGVMGLSDFFCQLFDIAAGQFRIDARLAGVLQLHLDSLKVDHAVPLSRILNPSEQRTG